MADNQLTVVRADGTTETLRSVEHPTGVHEQVVLISDGPESVPVLTGSTLGLIAVSSAAATALDPPDAGARKCFVRAWETSFSTSKRLFYRRDGTAPTNAGLNCEGYLLHGEARVVCLADLTQFKVIAESGSAWQIACEFSNT